MGGAGQANNGGTHRSETELLSREFPVWGRASARSVDVNSQEHMVLFVLLSSALTGLPPKKLAPGFKLQSSNSTASPPPVDLSKSLPGSDPVNVKREYLTWANDKYPSGLEDLLQLVRKNLNSPNREQAIIDTLQFGDDDKGKTPADIGRSVALPALSPAHLCGSPGKSP